MTKNISFYLPLLLIGAGLLAAGCSKSDDQRQFEDQARTEPSGISEMSAGGEPTDTQDRDDWQIAPMFAGYVEVEKPAFPNPVSFNSNLRIELTIYPGLETLQYIEVWAFEFPGQFHSGGPLATVDNVSASSLLTITLNAGTVAGSTGGSGASGIYRLLLYDGRENLISYGDVRVEN